MPGSLILSIPDVEPTKPMNKVVIPHALFKDDCYFCLNGLPVKHPKVPPATILALLIIVPIIFYPFTF